MKGYRYGARRSHHILLVSLCCLLWGTSLAHAASLQDELCEEYVAHTGNNATLIVPVDAIQTNGGFTLQEGDLIAAFNSNGLCVGEAIWNGDNLALTLWGNDGMTESTDGLVAGETFYLKLWSNELGTVINSETAEVSLRLSDARPHFRSEARYSPDAIYVVEELRIAYKQDN